tara:strand:+ start:844 stop:1101 length:258 start_codon:yes stop_codon:yes gene_type:complete
MSASSVRAKFMAVEKEKKRQTRLMEENALSADKAESAPIKKEEPVRARNEDGTLKSDDLSTKEFNEAWVGGKSPKKKTTAKKKKS